jgi:protein-tyrosine phosphatase
MQGWCNGDQMKYGIYFLVLAALMLSIAIQFGGWYWAMIYPASSFAIVAIGYLGVGPRVFGKDSSGKRSLVAKIFLFPYLVFTIATWHLVRLLSQESAVDMVDPNLFLSRRLLSDELPNGVKTVVDLTCEFTDPTFACENYLCFPMLDASCPTADELKELAEQILAFPMPVLIHCAQGHGRTGLVACAVLLASGKASSPTEALALLKASRPGIELNAVQRKTLDLLRMRSSVDQCGTRN